MILAKLGTTDITNYINETSYKIDSVPVEHTWTDANYMSHTDELRRRIEGSFDLAFRSDTEYNSFLTLLNEYKSGNLLRITVYVSGDVNALQDIICTYKLSQKSRREANSSHIVTILTMDIKER